MKSSNQCLRAALLLAYASALVAGFALPGKYDVQMDLVTPIADSLHKSFYNFSIYRTIPSLFYPPEACIMELRFS